MRRGEMAIAWAVFLGFLFFPDSGQAAFHLWKIDEVYSNASGTVQFIEMFDPSANETAMNGATLASQGHSFTFGANLPAATATQNHHLLLATPGYFALTGVPTA